jgi:hypothetical protein
MLLAVLAGFSSPSLQAQRPPDVIDIAKASIPIPDNGIVRKKSQKRDLKWHFAS